MKILIAAPIFSFKDDRIEEYLNGLKRLDYRSHTVDLFFVDNTDDKGEYVRKFEDRLYKAELPFEYSVMRIEFDWEAHSRERVGISYAVIRNHFLAEEYDVLFIIEEDVIIEADTLTLLIKEIKGGRDIVSAWVYAPGSEKGCSKRISLWGSGNHAKREKFSDKEFKTLCSQQGVFQVGHVSFGCIMITYKVLKKISFEWNHRHVQHPDIFFCDAVRREGFEMFFHSRVKPKHLWKEWRKERGGPVPL